MSYFEPVRTRNMGYAGEQYWLTNIFSSDGNLAFSRLQAPPCSKIRRFYVIIKISGLVSFFINFMHLSPMENASVRDFHVTFCQVYVGRAFMWEVIGRGYGFNPV